MTDEDCYDLTGLYKSNFEHLNDMLKYANINSSFNRSRRNALGVFLTKLRLRISNKVLKTIFQFSNAQAISRTLLVVHEALMSAFVPNYIGFNCISREDVINNHSSAMATHLFGCSPNSVILIIDGTYLFVQVSNIYLLNVSVSDKIIALFVDFRRAEIMSYSDERSILTNDVRL